jgi:hypothetical protein
MSMPGAMDVCCNEYQSVESKSMSRAYNIFHWISASILHSTSLFQCSVIDR